MSGSSVTALSPTEGTVFIPLKRRKTRFGLTPVVTENHNDLGRIKHMFKWSTAQKSISAGILAKMSPTIAQLVEFSEQDPLDLDASFGITEVPTALVVGRDRPLLSAVLDEVTETTTAAVVRLDEGDCSNSTSAMRALVSGFIARFEEADAEPAAKKKASTTLAPFDMARLVTTYEDYYSAGEKHMNLLVVIEQLESFDTDVMQDIIYTCSKHSEGLPISFMFAVSDESYIHQAFTAATRAMLDVSVFRPPSGSPLCLSVIYEAWKHGTKRQDQLMLGESSIKVLKDIIDRTDGCIDGLLTGLHLIHMEHARYQTPVIDAACKCELLAFPVLMGTTRSPIELAAWDARITANSDNVLSAFVALSRRRLPLADGFSPGDVERHEGTDFLKSAISLERAPFAEYSNMAIYGLTALFELTQTLYDMGAYRQEIPLSYLDLLELHAKGGQELRKYMTWMLKKGFESASSIDLVAVAQTVLGRLPRHQYGDSGARLVEGTLQDIIANESELGQQDKANYASSFVAAINWWLKPKHAYYELYITESSDSLKELIDPTPRSVVLSGLIRPGAYLHCDCCDPEDAQSPESMARSPDTCALLQRSLEAGRLLNVADWFNAFVGIMQNENVKRSTHEPEPVRVRRGVSRSRRATSSVHMESDVDAEGEVDEALEIQKEHQARFLLSAHELEFLGLIQATGRRKEHVLRTVFETGD